MQDDPLQLSGAFDPGTLGPDQRAFEIGIAADPRAGLVHIKFTSPLTHFALDGQSTGDWAIKLIEQLDGRSMAKIALHIADLAHRRHTNTGRLILPNFDPNKRR